MKIRETTLIKPIVEEKDRTKLPETVLCRLTYNICNVNELNANKRVYERDVWDKVLSNETLKEMIENRRLFGQAEHPTETQSDLQLTSHVVHNMWIDEKTDKVYQTLDVLDTPMGRIVDCLIRADCGVGVSTRAEGDLEESEDDRGKFSRVIPESYKYITTDFTADPSTFNVLPTDVRRNVASSFKAEMENKTATSGERKFARMLLESMQCTDKSKCQNCGICSSLKDTETKEKKEVKEIKLDQAIKDKVLAIGSKVKYENKDFQVSKIDETTSQIIISPDVEGREVRVEQDGVIIDGNPFVKVGENGEVTIMPISTLPEQPQVSIPEPIPAEGEPGHEEMEIPEEEKLEKELGVEEKIEEEIEKATTKEVARLVSKRYKVNFAIAMQTAKSILDDLRTEPYVKFHRPTMNDVNTYLDKLDRINAETAQLELEMEEKKTNEGMDQLVARRDELLTKKETGKYTEEECQELEGIESKLKDMEVDLEERVNEDLGKDRTLDIMFDDLNPEAQKDVLDLYRIASPEEGNFEVQPLFVLQYTPEEFEGENESIDEGFRTDLKNMDKKAVLKRLGEITDKLLKGESLSGPDKTYWDAYHTELEKRKNESTKKAYRKNESTDLRIKEAITRAEKEKALEVVEELSEQLGGIKNESSDSKLRLKMLMNKMKEATSVYDEVNVLRAKLEEKAKLLHEVQESLKQVSTKLDEESKKREKEILEISETHKNVVGSIIEKNKQEVTSLNESGKKQITSTKEEYETKVVESKKEGINEGRTKVLSEYVDRRLAELGLSIGENTRALLDGCESIEDVEDVLDKTKDIQRRNALHSEPIEGIRIKTQNLDPEQARVDKEVGIAFEGMH